jgi:hypothetical protein
MLLDGHIRIEVLKDLGIEWVECLISTDDEAFTYNKRISRLAPIQEHKMIRKAIERGVSEEKIALALDLNPRSIVRKAKLLDGICEEAVVTLKDKHCATAVFEILRKMKAMRQIEAPDRGRRADGETKQLLVSVYLRDPCRNASGAAGRREEAQESNGHHPRGHGPKGARTRPIAERDQVNLGHPRQGPSAADGHKGMSGKVAQERTDRPIPDATSAGVSGEIQSCRRNNTRSAARGGITRTDGDPAPKEREPQKTPDCRRRRTVGHR